MTVDRPHQSLVTCKYRGEQAETPPEMSHYLVIWKNGSEMHQSLNAVILSWCEKYNPRQESLLSTHRGMQAEDDTCLILEAEKRMSFLP